MTFCFALVELQSLESQYQGVCSEIIRIRPWAVCGIHIIRTVEKVCFL